MASRRRSLSALASSLRTTLVKVFRSQTVLFGLLFLAMLTWAQWHAHLDMIILFIAVSVLMLFFSRNASVLMLVSILVVNIVGSAMYSEYIGVTSFSSSFSSALPSTALEPFDNATSSQRATATVSSASASASAAAADTARARGGQPSRRDVRRAVDRAAAAEVTASKPIVQRRPRVATRPANSANAATDVILPPLPDTNAIAVNTTTTTGANAAGDAATQAGFTTRHKDSKRKESFLGSRLADAYNSTALFQQA